MRPNASFIDPNGTEHFFNVDTLTRTGSKKGSTQEILDSVESRSQDQGNKATTFNMSAYFTGQDYDIPTDAFYKALELQYTIDKPGILKHPRWGNINVFPLGDFPQTEELISGAMVGRIDITFTKVFNRSFPETTGGSLSTALTNIDEIEEISDEIAEGIDVSNTKLETSIQAKLQNAVGIISNSLSEITKQVKAVQDEFTAIQDAINNTIDDVAGNIIELISQTQQLIRLPAKIVQSFEDKINGYASMIETLCDNFNDPNEVSQANRKNNALMMELFSGYGVAVLSESTSFADYSIRSQAISSTEIINDSLDFFTDSFNEARAYGLADEEFSGTHNLWSLMFDTTARIKELLLLQAFDLKAEKRIILNNNIDIVNLCYELYGNIQEETLQFFILTNGFNNDDFYELSAGTEIVSYA